MTDHSLNFPPPDAVRKTLLSYGFDANPKFCEKVRVYASLLLRWNLKVNLTTITDPKEILHRHFGESLFAATHIPRDASALLDVGSGAGFPGLVLKLAHPELRVTLMEPVLKKAAFLKEAARILGIEVRVLSQHTQETPANAEYDFVTTRAVRVDHSLLSWVWKALVPHGLFLCWLGKRESRLAEACDLFEWNAHLVPFSSARYLEVGKRK